MLGQLDIHIQKNKEWSWALFLHSKLQRENQALCAPLLGMQLHTQRYPRRIQDFPHILRLTRVLLRRVSKSWTWLRDRAERQSWIWVVWVLQLCSFSEWFWSCNFLSISTCILKLTCCYLQKEKICQGFEILIVCLS